MTIHHSALVVEDNRHLCDVFSDTLSDAGYDVRCAHDGEAAWTEVQRDPPDVILSDIRMPKLDGVGLAARLVLEAIRIPLILMSANPLDRTVVCAAFIRKPFELDELLALIANVLKMPATKQVGAAD
jgi:DNA-binding response OmpR family regulator